MYARTICGVKRIIKSDSGEEYGRFLRRKRTDAPKTVTAASGQPLFPDVLKYVSKKGTPVTRYFAGSKTPFLPLFCRNRSMLGIFHGRGHNFHSPRK